MIASTDTRSVVGRENGGKFMIQRSVVGRENDSTCNASTDARSVVGRENGGKFMIQMSVVGRENGGRRCGSGIAIFGGRELAGFDVLAISAECLAHGFSEFCVALHEFRRYW
jgi:hypothetical protein